MPAGHTTTQLAGIANLALQATVRDGFVEAFETFTFARRLEALLGALNSLRLASREFVMGSSPFPDSIGRFGIIQSFRYAIVPPQPPQAQPNAAPGALPSSLARGPHRLSLNVCFDGGWEPYLRVVYRDLGPLLDAIFCNCEDYPLSVDSGMDEYTKWVRRHEVTGGTFYTESAMSVGDQRYLAQVEKAQREADDPLRADVDIAGLALVDPDRAARAALAEARVDPRAAIQTGLRALRALHALRPLYPANAEHDDRCLLRLAQQALPEFHRLVSDGDYDTAMLAPEMQGLKEQYTREIDWFMPKETVAPIVPRPLPFDPAAIQAGILRGDRGITHGCLVMFHVADADKARVFLGQPGLACAEGAPGNVGQYCNLALTYPGLLALGLPAATLADWPQEFIDGMEARAGLLGDVHANHPDRWQRPLRNWPAAAAGNGTRRIELSAVHGVIQFRIAAPDVPDSTLHPALAERIGHLDGGATGLTVLSVQAMRRHLDAEGETVEHFGFRDGISQPKVFEPRSKAAQSAPLHWDDAVRRGELLLGYPGDRDDRPFPAKPDRLLDNGCFLVIRKLSQDVGLLDEVLEAQARRLAPGADPQVLKTGLKERMMGRRLDGRPLVGAAAASQNDFNYAGDPHGARCPFHAHVRRANPRQHGQPRDAKGRIDGVSPIPRILRRGMSYGAEYKSPADRDSERGLLFMAYAASIAEQFEVIQRWISGGNSSGVLSTHNDPLLGTAAPGAARRVFRHLDESGNVVRLDLGNKPFTALRWGLYLFVPSIEVLRNLNQCVHEAQAALQTERSGAGEGGGASRRRAAVPPDLSIATWRALLEDDSRRDDAWRQVRAAPRGCLRTDYGVLVGSKRRVMEVLRDDGSRLSVRGYGERFESSIGPGYLGLDPGGGHSEQSPQINKAIEAISASDAYRSTRAHTGTVLAELRRSGQPNANGEVQTPIDILEFSDAVLARLCTEWFGLPDPAGVHMVAGGRPPDQPDALPVQCPGHFVSVSRHVFQAHPSITVQRDGMRHGQAIQRSVKGFLAAPGAVKGTLVRSIESALDAIRAPGADGDDHADRVASTVAGVMLGFAPTVQGNFYQVMRAWIGSRKLWDLQTALPRHARPDGAAMLYRPAAALLKGPLLAQMRAAPVPNALWRTQLVDGKPWGGRLAAGEVVPVIVGIGSAVRDALGGDKRLPGTGGNGGEAAANRLLFGGARNGVGKAPHACPGREMAIGVLLGLVAGLLEAGSLRPTPSPTTLSLVEPRRSG